MSDRTFFEEYNVITLGAAATACGRCRRWSQATALLACCTSAEPLGDSSQRRAAASHVRLEVNVFFTSTAINALSKENWGPVALWPTGSCVACSGAALGCLHGLREKQLEVNHFCFNSAISSTAWRLSLGCLEEMRRSFWESTMAYVASEAAWLGLRDGVVERARLGFRDVQWISMDF